MIGKGKGLSLYQAIFSCLAFYWDGKTSPNLLVFLSEENSKPLLLFLFFHFILCFLHLVGISLFFHIPHFFTYQMLLLGLPLTTVIDSIFSPDM